ncbi:zinc finger protein 518B [Tiliqua scincoides]|uniref:zinc finger protein 518B n=1 Tax=Tiliqua scincoides TaxID=71010 RepID=UPI003462078E
MQLKKMTATLPALYASQVNKEHSSLMTSPMQGSADKANPTTTKDKNNQNGSYQKSEDPKSSQISCIKCSHVQEISSLELQKQRGGDNSYICNKCRPNVPSVDFVTDPTGISDIENKKETTRSKILRTFKVKNFQPDKHYCDKCRFSTKDPLLYKKHAAQHEEIQFVCLICHCVSYTKGEFQRHLVKHTGKFPYKCRYCDYGAIRHDYIVKHIKRLHKMITEEQKVEPSTNCLTKQNPEKRPAQEVPLQNKSSTVSFNTAVSGIQDEMPEVVCVPSSVECSHGTALIQDERVAEPPDIGIHQSENAVIEVELCSPPKEPIMPGMPLMVVAPAKFVASPNCLAEVVEIKNANGVQHLVLKLVPVQEITPTSVKCQVAEYVNPCAEHGEETIGGSISPTFGASCALSNECGNDFGYMVSPSSAALNCNLVNVCKKNVMCKENEERENLVAVAELSPDEINSPKNLNFGLNSPMCLAPSPPEGGNRPQNDLSDAVPENYSNYPLESNVELQQNKPVCLDGPKTVTVSETESQKENICVDSSEAPNVKNEGGSSEGPVISSVFSLSSSAVNIPEEIRWDDMLCKKSSTSLLCRKIAQLMSAAESNVKSQLVGSLRRDQSPLKEEKPSSLEAPEKLERNDLAIKLEPDSVPSPQRSTDTASSLGPSSRKEQAQTLDAQRARAKKRVFKKAHASPVFIPQGTVLRVFDGIRTKSLTDRGYGNEILPSPVLFCNSTFLPRPVPCVFSEKCTEMPSSLPFENGVKRMSTNQSGSHRHRKKRKRFRKRKQKKVLPYLKGSEINKAGEEAKKKGKQAVAGKNLTKKSPQSQEDCYIINVDPILTRCLRLIPFKKDQLIKCPHRNQPVVVLNHPDVDAQEIVNVMKIINKYKCNVVKAVLSERTINCLGVKRHHGRLTFQSFDRVTQMKKLNALKMKLKKIHRNMYKVINSSPAEASKQTFKCCFCGRTCVDQEEWISHEQKHLMEATGGWDVHLETSESDEEEIIVD